MKKRHVRPSPARAGPQAWEGYESTGRGVVETAGYLLGQGQRLASNLGRAAGQALGRTIRSGQETARTAGTRTGQQARHTMEESAATGRRTAESYMAGLEGGPRTMKKPPVKSTTAPYALTQDDIHEKPKRRNRRPRGGR